MNPFILLIASLQAPAPAAGEAPVAPEIALLTMGPGDFIWERYGHAAIQVRLPSAEDSLCYNYGSFDFRKPVALFWGIIRSEPVFWVSAQPCGRFIDTYIRFDRTVYRQVIPLEPAAAIKLAHDLVENAKPENKYYVYHHFWDNCSTRPRDHLNRALGGALEKGSTTPLNITFRSAGWAGLADNSFYQLALDTFIGRGGDHAPNLFEAAALPDYLRLLVEVRAGVKPEVVYQRRGPAPPTAVAPWYKRWGFITAALATPALVAWLLGAAVRLGVGLSLFLPTLCGLILWFLAIASNVSEFRYNEMLLVFVPLDFLVVFLSDTARPRYARARLGMLVGVLILNLVGVLKQPLFGPILLVAIPLLTAAFPLRRRSGREELQWI